MLVVIIRRTRHLLVIQVNYPLRNHVYEKIKQAGNLTDVELMNSLTKEGMALPEADLNKILLDLEIFGLIRVSWVTKDKRRIEVAEA